jgi:hypothetical protein
MTTIAHLIPTVARTGALILALIGTSALPMSASAQSLDAPKNESVDLVMYSTDGAPVARYHLENAWPTRVEAEFDASKDEVSVESLARVATTIQQVR